MSPDEAMEILLDATSDISNDINILFYDLSLIQDSGSIMYLRLVNIQKKVTFVHQSLHLLGCRSFDDIPKLNLKL